MKFLAVRKLGELNRKQKMNYGREKETRRIFKGKILQENQCQPLDFKGTVTCLSTGDQFMCTSQVAVALSPDAISNCLSSLKRLLAGFYLARLEETDSEYIYTSVLWTKPKCFSLYENQGIHILQMMTSEELSQKRQTWYISMEYSVFHDHSKPQQLSP